MVNKVILAGKPNVGKSSLFNSMIGKNFAIVNNFPGVTRDVRFFEITAFESKFTLIDTAGIKSSKNKLETKINKNSLKEFKNADLILLIFDGKEILTKEDFELTIQVRKLNKTLLTVINKAEGKINNELISQISKLGFDNPLKVSAAHNQGIDELKFLICESLKLKKTQNVAPPEFSMCIVGKVNSGKSTLFNRLSGEERSITGEIPNLTRDSVEHSFKLNNKGIKIFDTAGFYKSDKTINTINFLSIKETKRKIRLCQISLIIIDIENYYERIHSKIIDLIYNDKRCIILVINKIDKYKEVDQMLIKKKIYKLNPQVNEVPIFFISAKNNSGLNELRHGIENQLICWNHRVNTGQLNTWLRSITKEIPPPLYNGRLIKLKYAVQVDVGPPKFNIFTNHPDYLKESYKRYVINRLRKRFNFNGLPIKIIYKKASNPYE